MTATVELGGMRVLLVEDQALIALDLQEALEDRGAFVVGPCFGLDAAMRATAAETMIDGAILDVDLGAEDVFPLANRLIARGVPFLFHTGRTDLDRLHGRYADAPVFLKPARAEDIAHQLCSIIDGAGRANAASRSGAV